MFVKRESTVFTIFILLVIPLVYLRILHKLDSLETTVIPRIIMYSIGRGPGSGDWGGGGGKQGELWIR